MPFRLRPELVSPVPASHSWPGDDAGDGPGTGTIYDWALRAGRAAPDSP